MTTYLKKQEVEFKDPSTGEVLSVLEELETPGTEYLNITLKDDEGWKLDVYDCLLYTSPSPRDPG